MGHVPKNRVIQGLDLELIDEGLDSYRDGSLVLFIHTVGSTQSCCFPQFEFFEWTIITNEERVTLIQV
jgi:hypothetical protein